MTYRRGNVEFAKRMLEVIEVNINQISRFEVVDTLERGAGGGVRMIFRKVEKTQVSGEGGGGESDDSGPRYGSMGDTEEPGECEVIK